MKYGVNKEILLITAGTVWIIAGANILRIGIVTWLNNSEGWMFKIGEATIVFLLMRCLPTDYYFTEEQLMKFTEEQKYAALEAAGLAVLEVKEKRGWECIVCKKA